MADATGNIDAKNYGFDVPVEKKAFFLKGLDHYDWGIKDRMSRIFDSKSGNTVMLAFDHGYIMGPTSGLERIDLGIIPLAEYADCLMCTRGVLRSCVPPEVNKPISLRVSAGTTVLTELNDEKITSGPTLSRKNTLWCRFWYIGIEVHSNAISVVNTPGS